jgi:hypothetical protein
VTRETAMSELVTSFVTVKAGDQRFLFFFVTWNDFVTPISDELRKHREAFGEALGPQGSVVQAFRSATGETFQEVVRKDWPAKVIERMDSEQDPFMLVIGEDFKSFDPKIHRWTLVWFSDFWKKTDSIWRVFAALAQKVRKGENIFDYLEGVSRIQKYASISKYIEIKTGLFGTSIDVKAIIEDLLGVGFNDI